MTSLAPRRLTVFGVLGLVFGAFGLLGALFGLGMSAIFIFAEDEFAKQATTPEMAAAGMDPAAMFEMQKQMTLYGSLTGLVTSGLLIAGGIFLLMKKRTGVTLFIWQAVLGLVVQVAMSIYMMSFYLNFVPVEDGPPQAVMQGMMIFGVLFSLLVPLAWLLLILLFLNGAKVKAYFSGTPALENAFTVPPPLPPPAG